MPPLPTSYCRRLIVKTTFWLLDINTETTDGKQEVWLWGIDSKGNRVLIGDRSFVDYFYAVVEEGCEPAKVAEEIKKAHGDQAVKMEVVQKRFFGKPVQAIKVYTSEKAKLAKQVRSIEGVKECLEDDIRLSTRYLIDNNVVPCSWHEAETQPTDSYNVQADKMYKADSPPNLLAKTETPDLRILSFYLTCYSREGSPQPNRNPIIIISTATNTGKEKQFLADENKNDKQLLQDFIKYVQDFNPDVIAGYETNSKHMAYLKERCRLLKLKLKLDRAGTEPHTSVYGHVSLIGTANVDLADFADQFPEVNVKTLENLADHLGVMKIDSRQLIWDIDFPNYWDDPKKCGELKQFAMDNARCIKGLTAKLLDTATQLSSLVSMPLDHVMTAATGFRVESFLMKQTPKIGELIPKRVQQPYRTYAGGLVLSPKPGLHENIAVLDFKSMYPNLMITYNLSPDTYVSPKEKEPESGVFEAPEVKHRFRKEPPGFYKETITYLINVRNEIRAKMKNLKPDSVEFRVLDAKQKAVKITTNAVYGYAGWIGARWYTKPVAEAASAYGRHTVQSAIDMAEKAGLQVIYGDTDSIFATYDEKKTLQLEKEIKKELGLEIELGNFYVRVFFTEAKKRYAGLQKDGTLDIVGLEVIRGDWAEIAKKTQEQVLEIILKEQSPQKAEAYVRTVIDELKQHKTAYRDLIVWKSLAKPIEEYEVNASHVEAAKMMQSKGWKLAVGDKVGYVIVKGEGKLYQRIKPYMYASPEEVDVAYYVEKQVVPAAARVLEFFGVNEETLLAAEKKFGKEKSLVEFLGA
jgi:DNA polymerase, archaea type